MRTHRMHFLTIAAIGLVTMAAGASQAAAQSSGGRFTLPCEVKWQGTVLPAGDYTFSLKAPELPAIVNVKGPDGRVFIFASALDEEPFNRPVQSTLTIEQRGGSSFISEMYLADLGLHLFYKAPKAAANEPQLARGPVVREQVLIAMAKK